MTAKKTPQVPGAPVVAPQNDDLGSAPVVAPQNDDLGSAPVVAKVDKSKPYLSPEGWVVPEEGSK